MPPQIRTYTGEQIDVTYDAQRCIHVGECLRRLPAVFDTSKRPWVQTDQAQADQVAATVLACPSGALHYQRKDASAIDDSAQEGGPAEPIQAHNTIRLMKNGPLYIRGDFTIVNSAGELVLKETRAALCRCGASANKPSVITAIARLGFKRLPRSVNRKPSLKPRLVAPYASNPHAMVRYTSPAISPY